MKIKNIVEVSHIMNKQQWQRLRWLIKASIVMVAIVLYAIVAWHQDWRHSNFMDMESPQVLQVLLSLLGK